MYIYGYIHIYIHRERERLLGKGDLAKRDVLAARHVHRVVERHHLPTERGLSCLEETQGKGLACQERSLRCLRGVGRTKSRSLPSAGRVRRASQTGAALPPTT